MQECSFFTLKSDSPDVFSFYSWAFNRNIPVIAIHTSWLKLIMEANWEYIGCICIINKINTINTFFLSEQLKLYLIFMLIFALYKTTDVTIDDKGYSLFF